MLSGTYTEGNLDLDQNQANIGVSLAGNLENSFFDQIEFAILRTLADVDYSDGSDTGITRVYTNLIKEFNLTDKSSLYGTFGIGFEAFDNEAFGNKNSPLGNFGVGYKYTFDNDLALKLDMKDFIETDHGDNSLIYTVGLAIPFGRKPPKKVIIEKEVIIEEEVILIEYDRDGDGVVDIKDVCPNTEAGVVVDEEGCPVVIDLQITFDFDSSNIKPTYNNRVKEFATFLKNNPNIKAKIEAHTDSTGSKVYNKILSQKRANSVVKALEGLNIDKSRLEAVGFGESKPIADNGTKKGRAKNRRVDALIKE